MTLGSYQLHIAQLARFVPVQPLAKLTVTPEDFPFLTQIRGHDDERVQEYATALQTGANSRCQITQAGIIQARCRQVIGYLVENELPSGFCLFHVVASRLLVLVHRSAANSLALLGGA